MQIEGGCYCGMLRYRAAGEPQLRLQCHCRECQTIAGGGPNFTLAMPAEGFAYTAGEPERFSRPDLERPVTREFCGTCGTHILTRSPRLPETVLIKVGSLDDPEAFGAPQIAIFTAEARAFHHIPDGLTAYPGPPR